jgi:DNA-binding beta-propeller fold protein YncE
MVFEDPLRRCGRSAQRHRALLAAAGAVTVVTGTGQAQVSGRDPASYIFVAARTRAEIAVIDSKTDTLIGRIALPGTPSQIVALGRGARLVVGDAAAQQVRMVDVASGRVERSVTVPVTPRILQANQAGSMLAVLDPQAGKVALLRVAGGPPLPISGLEGARYAAFDPQGDLLVAHGTSVAIIDTVRQSRAELSADPGAGPITHLATDPGGEYAFVVQGERGVLSVFTLRNRTRVAVLRLPAPLGRVVPSADSQFILVPVGRHAVSIVSDWTLRESGRIEVAGETGSVGLTLFQSVAAIAAEPGRRFLLYDLRDRRPLADLQLPGTPAFGAASPDGAKYYVALADTGQIAVVELTKRSTPRLIDGVGLGAWAVVPAVGVAYCH